MALGGWLFLIAAICDFLDGRIARESKTAGPSGAALDSVIDRYVDGVFFIGLAWFYRDSWLLILVLLALLGAMLVPYVRARGEALGVPFPNVGLAQRPERVAILGMSVALSPIIEAVVVPEDPRPVHRLAIFGVAVVAVAAHFTALQRLVHARRALDRRRQRVWWLRRHSLARGITAAFLATAFDLAIVVLLASGLGIWVPAATFAGCVVGGVTSFLTNRVWTFGSHDPPVMQGARYVLVSGSSALINSSLIAVVLLLPAVPYLVAWVLVRAMVFVSWNYPLHRDYVFASAGVEGSRLPVTPLLDRHHNAPYT
jgi:phosphatidylglycerophosphate synthase/putative flippase GtrA